LADPLITLLSHPNHTIRVNAAWALRCFCYSTPLRLPKSLLTIIDLLQRDINILPTPTANSDVQLRAVGHAYGLAALVSVIPERPLYISYDISAKVLDIAVQLLKSSGEHAIHVAGVEVEVAWTSIAALMSLGPNFVKPHLAQLLVLWRNALPKPTSKDTATNSTRTAEEWAFLLHVRESALGAVLEFLRHNTTPLVTLDVARRITSLLSNALLFVNSFSVQGVLNTNDPTSLNDATKTLLRSREALLRRRVFQCFTSLGFSSIPELTQTTLLQSAMSLFAGPDGYISSVQAAIAASSGSFTSIWQSTDGYAFGMTYIDIQGEASEDATSVSTPGRKDLLNRDTIEMSIDRLVCFPTTSP
jgi:HEAT repeat-containing protein 5